ncbi:hypothetical protein LS482_20350 [Sinomicrobium kalidii]|uniref:hypothetical protein n=1 Tax=Sinomicrobium kalidii TaxID=2900738 RepID=UPI001E31CFA7|nr:hypothetical protein [Sinomicrobium kalidii]UGU16016.1 hypothetical protein LS482_20350 [Sinomicrobium kalidii]
MDIIPEKIQFPFINKAIKTMKKIKDKALQAIFTGGLNPAFISNLFSSLSIP